MSQLHKDLIAKALLIMHGDCDSQAVHLLRAKFDAVGPFQCAKDLGCLVEGSGEEFAIAFMSYYNTNVEERY